LKYAVLLLVLVTGCMDALTDRYNDSLNVWYAKLDHGGTRYHYTRVTTSYFAGVIETTVITVRDGVVTARAFTSTRLDGSPLDSYSEEANTIGSHAPGHPPQPLDALYVQCSGIISKGSDTKEVTFETFEGGLMRDCYYVDREVTDDNLFGIQLTSIQFD
jgi:hypothetical protein